MDSTSMTIGSTTPVKAKTGRSRASESLKNLENANPNVSSPGLKHSGKSAKKSASKNPKPIHMNLTSPSPKKKIRERKFVIAKKKPRNEDLRSSSTTDVACEKCNKAIGRSKCLCVAYDSLRASQEEFFKNRGEIEDEVSDKLKEIDAVAEKLEISKASEKKTNNNDRDEAAVDNDVALKRSREVLFEEARQSVSASGSGRVRVMNLVKEFEKLWTVKSGDSEEKREEMKDANNNSTAEEFPVLQKPLKVSDLQVSSSSFCQSDFIFTSESLGLDSRRSYSLDSNHGSISTITSVGGRGLGRSSIESSRNHNRRQSKKKQPRATSQKPFTLKTEERGRFKEEEFMKKLQKMLEEEEKMRIPIAQGLPWTTDQPECLVKPPVKESTRPIDLVLKSDVRAEERSEFDQQVAMKMNLIEQYRMERERQQKLAEEEEVRRLRKELVPKAQPMPYFDRPFIPHRSSKQPTVPKEPKFHMPEHKKIKCNMLSDDDFCLYATLNSNLDGEVKHKFT